MSRDPLKIAGPSAAARPAAGARPCSDAAAEAGLQPPRLRRLRATRARSRALIRLVAAFGVLLTTVASLWIYRDARA